MGRILRRLLPATLVLACVAVPAAAQAAGERYVALGDSYTSGPLIPNPKGQPLGCGRSDHNYPTLTASAIQPATFTDVSCGSAETEHMTKPQTGLPDGNTNPPQFDALTPQTTLVTVGIGGNDAGLVGVGLKCGQIDATSPTGHKCRDYYTAGGRDLVGARIAQAAPKVGAVLDGIHQLSPRARVLIVGYPAVAPIDGSGCWPTVPISPEDLAFADQLLQRINAMIIQQAAANNAEFVDTYTDTRGHDVCKLPGIRWFEGLFPTSPAYPLHPNALGEASMSRSLLKALAQNHPIKGPALKISSYTLGAKRITVRGRIAAGYKGAIRVSFNGGYTTKSGRRTTRRTLTMFRATRAARGRWSTSLSFAARDRGRVRSGIIDARSTARDFLRAGYARRRASAK